MPTIIKQASTRFSIVKRSKGQSAVEQASYISRTEIFNEYDGKTYRPKYKEDLVHSEINLPENAPEEFQDRSKLWNSVEQIEKSQKAQLARLMKASLPNEWSYDLATVFVREYVQENFVDKGMCADWAIHDSENEKGERNLHFHLLLTIRPIEEDGSWGAKSRKVYILDEDGNKIRNKNGKGYKCTTEQTTDWNNRDNAKMWRTNLANKVNYVNQQLDIDLHWEHRSFQEQGLDIEPTIHLGPRVNAMEKKGIQTDRGNINREIIQHNSIIQQARAMVAVATENLQKVAAAGVMIFRNEVTNMIDRVVARKGRLDFPVFGTGFVSKVSNRSELQSGENAKEFVMEKEINSFRNLDEYSNRERKSYSNMNKSVKAKEERIEHLQKLKSEYAEYSKYEKIHKQYNSMKRLAKARYKRNHQKALDAFPKRLERMNRLLQEGDKRSPKAWDKEIGELRDEISSMMPELGETISNLAYTEVIDYNKRNLDRELENESRSRERQIEREPEWEVEEPPKKEKTIDEPSL